jgi:hypothetical protein
MIKKIGVSMLLALGAASPLPLACQVSSIDIYVTPFYNSEGPQVDVGRFSRELASADRESILEIAGAMEQELATLPVVTMYVAAIRLYDLGHRDEAVVWYYRAQHRASLFQAVLDPRRIGHMGSPAFELNSAHYAFNLLSGEHINGYAGCDGEKWAAVLDRLQAEIEALPDFTRIYPSVAFIPAKQWPSKNAEQAAKQRELAEYLKTHLPELKAERAENDADARFCGDG